MSDLLVHGTVLDGDDRAEPREIVVADGRVEPASTSTAFISTAFTSTGSSAIDLGRDRWILPGLVDAHCHLGLEAAGGVDAERTRAHAVAERDAGVLLVRDCGSPVDTSWVSADPTLPRVLRAGRHIARPKRYLRGFAVEVEPEDLVAEVERQVARGDGWVKLVGDWIDREQGDLAPLWPAEVAAAAIDRAHALGVRVTAHVFAEQAVTELVAAGIDCIEHGTGLDGSTIAEMARRQVALVPTLLQLENFPRFAEQGEAKFPRYAAHLRHLHARRYQVLGAAREAGVPIYAGTDAGGQLPHGLIAAEVQRLVDLGGPAFALGAASWRARSWLGAPGLDPGDPADLVVYDADPRADPGVLTRPLAVVLNGAVVAGPRVAS